MATETFYFTLHLLNTNVFLGHLIVFITYAIGLIFLYKIIKLLTGQPILGKLSVFLYAISFIHVFQLYWFATFQEVALFAFLSVSFYNFLVNRYSLCFLFFILASLCKETAVLYTPFVILFTFVRNEGNLNKLKQYIIPLSILTILTILFWIIYQYSLQHVTTLDNYKIAWHPRLLLNNGLWYFLWGIGFPNFMPDYFSSLLSKPIPDFWEAIKTPYTKTCLGLLFTYLFSFLALFAFMFFKRNNVRKYIVISIFCVCCFFIFLGPILFFSHKWMIRLTLPFIFIAFLQAWIIYQSITDKNKYTKYIGLFVLILYATWNYFGILVHQRTSTYLLENSIYSNAQNYFTQHRKEILRHDVIYFKDTLYNLPKGWNGSEKLKNSFSGSDFLDHFLPEKKMTVIYGFEDKEIPKNAYILESNLLL